MTAYEWTWRHAPIAGTTVAESKRTGPPVNNQADAVDTHVGSRAILNDCKLIHVSSLEDEMNLVAKDFIAWPRLRVQVRRATIFDSLGGNRSRSAAIMERVAQGLVR